MLENTTKSTGTSFSCFGDDSLQVINSNYVSLLRNHETHPACSVAELRDKWLKFTHRIIFLSLLQYLSKYLFSGIYIASS